MAAVGTSLGSKQSTVSSTRSSEMKPARILYWLDDDYDEAANLMGQLIAVTQSVTSGSVKDNEIELLHPVTLSSHPCDSGNRTINPTARTSTPRRSQNACDSKSRHRAFPRDGDECRGNLLRQWLMDGMIPGSKRSPGGRSVRSRPSSPAAHLFSHSTRRCCARITRGHWYCNPDHRIPHH